MVRGMESNDDIKAKIGRGARALAGQRFVTIGQAVDEVVERLRRAARSRVDKERAAPALDAPGVAPDHRGERAGKDR